MRQRKRPLRLNRANVIGIIESRNGFQAARAMAERVLDGVEIRLDQMDRIPPAETLLALPVPIIATARDPREGGANGLSGSRRAELYRGVLGLAQAIDVELAAAREMRSVIEAARAAKHRLILSFHDFKSAPPAKKVRELMRRAVGAGADVFKIAVTPRSPSDLAPLLELLHDPEIPVAAMGMGPLGRVSRLLFAACGSVLNYGWIERPVVRGQWSAAELRVRIDELKKS